MSFFVVPDTVAPTPAITTYDFLDLYMSSLERSEPKKRNNFSGRYVFDVNVSEYNNKARIQVLIRILRRNEM